VLRKCRQSDVDAVLAYRSRPDVAAHLSAGVWSRAKTERELAAYETAAFERAGDEDNSSSRALCERIGMRLQSASVSTDGRDIRECTYVLDRSREP